MPQLIVTPELSIPLEEFTTTLVRSSGPGGQNVNKVNTKAQIRWVVTQSPSLSEEVRARFLAKFASRITGEGEVLITSQRFRDAPRNVADCLEKLRVMIAAVINPPKHRKRTRPSRSSVRRRLTSKRQQSERKRGRRSTGLDQ